MRQIEPDERSRRRTWWSAMVVLAIVGLWGGPGISRAEINATDEDVPVSSLAGSAQPDPFTGALVFRLPLQVPPGRQGVQPNLELVYRSGNANDWVGVGWKLELGKIERKRPIGPTGELLPINYASDDYLFRLNGETAELVPVSGGSGNEYRAKIENRFWRFRKLTNSADNNRLYWEVTDRRGVKSFFGETPATRVVEPVGQQDDILDWLLDRVQDPHGNYLTVTYDLSLPALAYMQEIQYTGHNPTYTGPTTTGTILKTPTNVISFILDGPSNPVHTKFPNYNVVAGRRLRTIVVKANTSQLVRAYRVGYTPGGGETSPSLLASLQEIGKPTSVDAAGTVTGGLNAPTWTFTYGDVAPGLENVLAHIYNGFGAHIWPSMAEQWIGTFHHAIVTVMAVADGSGAPPSLTNYAYAGPFYHTPERDFRGYATTTITGPAGPMGEQRVTQIYWHQGNDVIPDVNNPNVPVGYTKGKPYRVKVFDGQGQLYSDTATTHQADPDGAPYFTPVSDVQTLYCDGTPCTKHTRIGYTYDSVGNVMQEDRYGDTATSADDVTIRRNFYTNSTDWLIEFPNQEFLYSGVPAGPQVAATYLCYDGTQPCTSTTTSSPTKGDLTKRVQWVNGGSDLITTLTYDAYGNPATVQEPWNGPSQYSYTSFDYDPTGTFVLETHHPGYSRNAFQYRWQTRQQYYGVNSLPMDLGLYGQVKSVSDLYMPGLFAPNPSSYLDRREYDALGRLTKRTAADGAATIVSYLNLGTVGQQHVLRSHPLGLTSKVYFDGLGRPTRREKTGPDSQTIVTQTQYDLRGTVRQQSLPGFASEPPLWRTVSYDPLGRLVEVLEPDGSRTTRCEDDWVVVTVDANGHKRREVRDVAGRPLTVEEYQGSTSSCVTSGGSAYATTVYQYDVLGNLRFVTDAQGNQTEWRYDTVNRVTFEHDPDRGDRTSVYLATEGLLDRVTNAAGKTVYWTYDAWGRVIQKGYGPPRPGVLQWEAAYAYDSEKWTKYGGRQLIGMYENPGWVHYSYDAVGRLITEEKKVHGSSQTKVQITYDGLGRLASVKYPDNAIVNYEYNGPWLKRVFEGPSASPTIVYAQFSNFTAAGQPRTITAGNGVATTLSYHAQNRRLTSRMSTRGASTLQNLGYSYDPLGNVSGVTDTIDGNQTFVYDELDRLTTATGPYGSHGYVYTPIGNLAYHPLLGAYTYPTSGISSVRPHAVSTAGPNTYGYDAAGNMTSVTGSVTRSLTYDHQDRPINITSNGTTSTMAYDGMGLRLKKTVGAVTTEYRTPYYECDKQGSTSTCVKYIWAGGQRIAMKQVSNGAVTYFHPDHLGSTSVVTNASGGVDQRVTYYPFGATRTSTGPANVPYKYTDQELDASTGLYYYKARYYDATLGRFLQADSIVPGRYNPQSWNRYAYVLNNPLKYTDPTGQAEALTDLGLNFASAQGFNGAAYDYAFNALAPLAGTNGGAGTSTGSATQTQGVTLVYQGGFSVFGYNGTFGSLIGSGVEGIAKDLESGGQIVRRLNSGQLEAGVDFAQQAYQFGLPVNEVGHSFGADTAVDASRVLDTLGIPVRVLVTLDAVGFDNTRIPKNIGVNLNFYQPGLPLPRPFCICGGENVALDPTRTLVINVPRPEGHFGITTAPDVINMIKQLTLGYK